MKFSFVLPAYKAKYLDQALKSIIAQSFSDFELIIVDDCSLEDLKSIVDANADGRVSYYRNEKNIGGSNLVAQWNHCLEFAKGDYVILATDDDLYDARFLETFVPLIEKYPNVDLFRSRILSVDAQGIIKNIDACYKEYLTPTEFLYHSLHGMRGGIPQYIFRRSALMEKGGFVSLPMAWGSDDATAILMSEHGVVNSQEHLVRFRWSDINISSDKRYAVQKVQARLLYSEWLVEHTKVQSSGGEWGDFYKRMVYDFIPLYNRLTLISTMELLNFGQWLNLIPTISDCNIFTRRDKMSIFVRTLKQQFHLA